MSISFICYLFELCCLCLTSFSPQNSPVLFETVNTTEYSGRFTDVVMPCQSYFSCVPDFNPSCITEVNLEKFPHLSASFGQSTFASEYDPWTYVDAFGRSKIYRGLLVSYKAVTSVPVVRSVPLEKKNASSVPDESEVKVPSRSQRKSLGSSSSTLSLSSKKLVQGSSKDYVNMYSYTF